MTTRSRQVLAFGLVAVVACAGELIFFYANAQAFGSVARALWWSTRFLTDWTGVLIASACIAAAAGWRRPSSAF